MNGRSEGETSPASHFGECLYGKCAKIYSSFSIADIIRTFDMESRVIGVRYKS
jgi:hypothetical protein